MSEAIEKTAAGSTRGFFGALGFILLMLGLEGMTGAAGIQFGLGLFLVLLGAVCFYAFFFWESAKRVLTPEAQEGIGRFAQSRVTRFGMLFLAIQVLIFSRFVEQHRWPFSYPADGAMINELNTLRSNLNDANATIGREKELADKWRFSTVLRQLGRTCSYQIQMTSRAAGGLEFWRELLSHGGWNESSALALAPAPGSARPGITIRTSGDTGVGAQCTGVLQRALTDIYPNPPSRIATNQQSEFLNSCRDCVQIEFDY